MGSCPNEGSIQCPLLESIGNQKRPTGGLRGLSRSGTGCSATSHPDAEVLS